MNGTSLTTFTRPGSGGGVGVGETDGVGVGAADGGTVVGTTDGVDVGVGTADPLGPADRLASTDAPAAGVGRAADGRSDVGWATFGGGAELHPADITATATMTSTSLSDRPMDNLRITSNASRRPEAAPSGRMVPSAR